MNMTKQEAAEFLGVKSRTIEHYAKQGRLSVAYTRGTRGQVATYNEEELTKLREELQQPAYPQRPQVAHTSLAKPSAQAIAEFQPETFGAAVAAGLVRELQPAISAEIKAHRNNGRAQVSTGDKLLLTLAEAQALTGLSRATLRAAVDEGKLKARIIGRAWRVKRKDLESFIQKL